jgi:hypothetical protein
MSLRMNRRIYETRPMVALSLIGCSLPRRLIPRRPAWPCTAQFSQPQGTPTSRHRSSPKISRTCRIVTGAGALDSGGSPALLPEVASRIRGAQGLVPQLLSFVEQRVFQSVDFVE